MIKKLLKLTINSSLVLILLGLIILPIGSFGMSKVKNQKDQGEVLSEQDIRVNKERIEVLEKELISKDNRIKELESILLEMQTKENKEATSSANER